MEACTRKNIPFILINPSVIDARFYNNGCVKLEKIGRYSTVLLALNIYSNNDSLRFVGVAIVYYYPDIPRQL